VFAWHRQDGDEERNRMRKALSGSFAGSILENLILEDREKQARRAERQFENSPARRKQQMEERQDVHKHRLRQKSDRDANLTAIGNARYGKDLPRSEMFRHLIEDGLT
jgi:hypothetical protein